MSLTSDIDNQIRSVLSPALEKHEFTTIDTRRNWRHVDNCIWVFIVKSVGKEFAQVTGFTSQSLTAELGIFYSFIPHEYPEPIKQDEKGQLLPDEFLCQMRTQLSNVKSQFWQRKRIVSLRERRRKDAWWIDPEGANIEKMIADMTEALNKQGIPWFNTYTDLEKTFASIEKERDCPYKYHRAMYFAQKLGEDAKYEHYKILLEKDT